jgi:hypothetical protein
MRLNFLAGIVMILLISCEEKQKKAPVKQNNSVDIFDDIDLFRLEGSRRMDHVSYPYIKLIKTTENERRVVYQSSEKDSTVREYWKVRNYWTTHFQWLSDTGYFTTYQFILPEKIVELNYNDTSKYSDFILHDGSIIEKNKEVIYSFGGNRGISIPPGIYAIDSIKNKVGEIITDIFLINNGVLTYSTSTISVINKKDTLYKDKTCYQVGSHSSFWWRQFSAKEVNCETR